MLNRLTLASLITLSVSVGAQPTPPPPPPHPLRLPADTCRASGDVLFEIADRVDPAVVSAKGAIDSTWTTTLYATGAWTYAELDGNGNEKRSAHGCLSRSTIRTIRGDLAHLPLVVKHGDATCAAISGTLLEYSSHGKLLWTQRMCQLDYLDDVSRKNLDDIAKLLSDATKPVTPPCCKK